MDLDGDQEQVERASALADAVLSLAEPWRTRFLELIARYARACGQPGVASRAEIVAWLSENDDLAERVRLMLRSWTRPS